MIESVYRITELNITNKINRGLALASSIFTSVMTLDTLEAPDNLQLTNSHSSIPGNEKADTLAKNDASSTFVEPEPAMCIPHKKLPNFR